MKLSNKEDLERIEKIWLVKKNMKKSININKSNDKKICNFNT